LQNIIISILLIFVILQIKIMKRKQFIFMKMYKPLIRSGLTFIICGLLIIMQSFTPKTDVKKTYCSEADFKKMGKIDIHCHISVDRFAFMEQAVAENFRILTINTDAFENPTIEQQQAFALKQIKAFPGHLAYLTTFSMKGWDNPDWEKKTIAYLENSFKKGAIGIKVWKNIGMVEKDKNGKFIMIDNPKFDPIFDYLEKKGIPVCGHLGEPKNCWLPIEKMTVNNDKKYFEEHAEYHMYLHPDFPSYEDQITARDNMLRKHPNLRFMGAHLGSLEWSVDELAKHFDMFPNMSVDMAARMCHIEKQAQADRQKVVDFFIKYQDRIIYGTDEGDYEGADADPVKLQEKVLAVWKRDWKFLTTDETMTSWEVDGNFKGLKLPKEVIEKIYHKNATKWFSGI
jgi:predicted TIM-barrel fold metal-dependent hydrolase